MYLDIRETTVRPMKRQDIAQVMYIINACFLRPYPESWVRSHLNCGDKGAMVLESAEYHGAIVSVMLFEQQEGALYVLCLATDPHFQRRGAGSKLIDWLKTQLTEAHPHIDLHVYSKEWVCLTTPTTSWDSLRWTKLRASTPTARPLT